MSMKKSKRGAKNDEAHRLQRRKEVASLYLQNLSQNEIARRLEVDHNTVQRDLSALREQWLAEALVDFDEKKARELAKLDEVEAGAWRAWARSLEDAETRRRKVEEAPRPAESDGGEKGNEAGKAGGETLRRVRVTTETMKKGQSGDPRFLEIITKCVDMRLKVLGAYKNDSKLPPGARRVTIEWDDLLAGPPGGPRARETDPIEAKIAEAERAGRVLEARPAETTPAPETAGEENGEAAGHAAHGSTPTVGVGPALEAAPPADINGDEVTWSGEDGVGATAGERDTPPPGPPGEEFGAGQDPPTPPAGPEDSAETPGSWLVADDPPSPAARVDEGENRTAAGEAATQADDGAFVQGEAAAAGDEGESVGDGPDTPPPAPPPDNLTDGEAGE